MGTVEAVVVFLLIWWMVLFMVLPIGVVTQAEEGEVVPGSAPSAPARPRLWRKLALTTGIAVLAWGAVILAIRLDVFQFRESAASGYATETRSDPQNAN